MRKIIDKGLELSLIFLMAFLVVDVLWQVLSRYILVSPSSVTDELAGYLLIWVGLLGAAYVSGKNEHLAIDLLLQHIRPSRRKLLRLFIFLIVFFIRCICIDRRWDLAGIHSFSFGSYFGFLRD